MNPDLKREPLVFAVGAWILLAAGLAADEAEPPNPRADGAPARTNFELLTLGGKQFWSDELVLHDWRIQRHSVSGHCRLLDDRNVRRAWGDFGQCHRELRKRLAKLELPRQDGRFVILLHGLVRSRDSMSRLAEYLGEHSDYEVVNVSYASTRADIHAHAKSLSSVVRHLGAIEELNFVGHSMGNLVVRRYLAMGDANALPKLRRVVMLAPPNNGSELASRFRENQLFRVVWGTSGIEIADWDQLEGNLATPSSFGIIAGGYGSKDGGNPLIAGDDDFVVSVDETRLPGARDFFVFPVFHGSIVDHPQIHELTLRFLKDGYFISEDRRQPIPLESIQETDDRTERDKPVGGSDE